MDSLFGFLLFASFICLIVGLISPSTFVRIFGQKVNRKKIGYVFGGLLVAFFVLTGAFADTSNQPAKNDQPASVQQQSTPKIEIKEEKKTDEIAFETQTKDDPTLAKGTTRVSQEGKNGTRETVYKVTYSDGKEIGREKISENITVQPVFKIVLNGTKVATSPKPKGSVPPTNQNNSTPPINGCDPNYSGACVPIDTDVDCVGGSGNGPSYVRGPVNVIGIDIYDLDRDGDGIGCES